VAHRCDVVIPTRGRPDALVRCLDGLKRQSVDGFRVIVVDDDGEVPAAAALDERATDGLDVALITLDGRSGPAAARNAGVAHGDAEFVVFIDDDVVPNRYFLESHLATVTASHDPDRPIVSCGPFVQPADWTPTPWNLWEARQAKKEADNLLQGRYRVTWRQFHTGNNCLPRRVFTAVGGFDEAFRRAEDDELGLRLDRFGCEFRFEPGAIAWHYSNRSLDAWLSIPRAYAHYDVEIDRRYPEQHWLDKKYREHEARRWPLRAVRRLLDGTRRRRAGVAGAVTVAQALDRIGLTDLSLPVLSVAYDLSYTDALHETLAGRGGSH
jgi:GT2 family glycosyltransferase